MKLDKSQTYFLKGYIRNINDEKELHGVELTLRMLGVDCSQVEDLIGMKGKECSTMCIGGINNEV